MNTLPRLLALSFVAALPLVSHAASLTVTARNPLPFARARQTLELTAAQLAPLGVKELDRVHVADGAGHELLCQAVDTDYDAFHTADMVIFQADFGANETKTFTVSAGKKQEYTKDQFKAFGRFVRERFDDFAWENDRIAHRTYGHALETWEGEPLSSSTIDIWSKRTSRLVINDWYLTDHYHEDTGEGADFYSAGRTRGCGGNGLWAADQLWTSRCFIHSRVLANGPIRVMFELDYAPFDVNGMSVSETKRITLDAGSQLDHFESIYKPYPGPGKTVTLTSGIGLKKVGGEATEADAGHGWMLSWQNMEKKAGQQGIAVIVDPTALEKQTQDKLNNLLLVKCTPRHTVSYWAGFCWDKAGQITSAAAWKQYVDEFAQGAASPLEVSIAEK